MKRSIRYYRKILLKHDLPSGFSVFLVALPLCLGIALASGAPIYSGLLSGIIGGLVVSIISGSPLSVSGPAAGLTTLVASSIVSLGNYNLFLLAVMLAGFFQLALGLLKLGAIANYFPSSVIKGMLAAIGIILISKQIPLALGFERPYIWSTVFLHLFTSHDLPSYVAKFNEHISGGAIMISVISLVILISLQQSFAQKLRVIPAPLFVVAAGILLNIIFERVYPNFSLSPSQLVQIPSNIFKNIIFPDFSKLFSRSEIWKDGLTIGLLATLETLLCEEAVDKLDKQNRITPVNRELVAQGIGNITCGLLGAIPVTAVVIRGAANVDAGGKTKGAAITHGVFLLIAVLLFPFILNKIPYASLSAILIVTGYNLTNPKLYRNMWNIGWKQFIPFALTILVILSTDLLIGVFIGLMISIYFIIQNNFKAEYKISKSMHLDILSYHIKLNSNVTFLNKVNLKKALDEIPEYSVLKIDGSECNYIDYDILEVISEFHSKAHDRHIELHLNGIEKVNTMALH